MASEKFPAALLLKTRESTIALNCFCATDPFLNQCCQKLPTGLSAKRFCAHLRASTASSRRKGCVTNVSASNRAFWVKARVISWGDAVACKKTECDGTLYVRRLKVSAMA